MQDWTPDQYKTFEPLFIQIGSLEPDLLIFEVLAKNFDARRSLFFFHERLFLGFFKGGLVLFFPNKIFKIFIFSYTFYLLVLYLADITSRAI